MNDSGNMTPEGLIALAAACRKAGITSFKGHGVEFTLGEAPKKATRRRKGPEAPTMQVQGPNGLETVPAPQTKSEEIPTDSPTMEELMFWSAGGVEESQTEEGTA